MPPWCDARQLDAAEAKRIKLKTKLKDLRIQLVDQAKLSRELERELTALRHAAELEQAQANQRINELEIELKFVIRERERIEKDLERQRAEYSELLKVKENIQDLLDLYFQRAEYERTRYESALSEVSLLKARVTELKGLQSYDEQ